jgi:SAM-dependent methyltransferase
LARCSPDRVARSEGAELFGSAAVAYPGTRPAYPDRVYELLVEHCGLAEGCRTVEVGAGSGQATQRLLETGARPLVAVEPDPGFAKALETLAQGSEGALVPVFATFESAQLREAAFDLAVSATAFHWLDRATGPRKLGACLRPGGWLALFWNVFGDPRLPDPFHEATVELLSGLAINPSHPPEASLPFALDRDARRSDFRAAGADRDFRVEEIRWTLRQSPRQVRALYATFSSIARLAERERETLLDRIESIAETQFGGTVERRIVTPVYLGRRAS